MTIYIYIAVTFRHLFLLSNSTYFYSSMKKTPLVIETINFAIESLAFQNRHLMGPIHLRYKTSLVELNFIWHRYTSRVLIGPSIRIHF